MDDSAKRHKVVANDISDVFSDRTIELGCSKTLNGNVINHRAGVIYNRIIIDEKRKLSL